MAEPTIEDDLAVAKAARDFYKSRVWWELYQRGVMPREWPEYIALRDAIMGKAKSK